MMHLESNTKIQMDSQVIPSNQVYTLGSIEIPERIIEFGENLGVPAALEALEKEGMLSKSFKGAAAITIMEALYKNGFCEKVSLFARIHGASVAETLENNTQKIEFFIRLAALLKDNDRSYFQTLAVDLLNFSKSNPLRTPICPSHALILLARLYAEAGDVDLAIYWLSHAETTRKDYRDLTEIFFRKGLFQEGVDLLDSYPFKHTPQYYEEDFVELLAQGLRNKELLKNIEYQEALAKVRDDSNINIIMIKWRCHLGDVDYGLSMAKELSIKKNNVYYLLQFSQFMKDKGSNNVYISEIREVAKASSKPLETIKSILNSNLFSVSEDIETCALLPREDWKIQVLVERTCGIKLNSRPSFFSPCIEDQRDIKLLLSAIIESLTKTSTDGYWGHPPHWVFVLRTYLSYESYEEALETVLKWKFWYVPTEDPGKSFSNANWVLSYIGILELALGSIQDGLSDLKKAYELQQKDWEICPTYANNFDSFIKEAIHCLSPIKQKKNGLNTLLVTKNLDFKKINLIYGGKDS